MNPVIRKIMGEWAEDQACDCGLDLEGLDQRLGVSDLTTLLDSLNAPTVEDDMALSLAGRVVALVARIKAVKS